MFDFVTPRVFPDVFTRMTRPRINLNFGVMDLVNRTFEFYKTVIAMTYSEFVTSEKRTELGLIFVNEAVMKVRKVVA